MRVDDAASGPEALAMLRREAAAGDPYRVLVYDVEAIGMARQIRADQAIAGTSLIHLVTTQAALN